MSMFKPGERVSLAMDKFESNRGELGIVHGVSGAYCVVRWDNMATKALPAIVFDFMLAPVKGGRNGLAIVD